MEIIALILIVALIVHVLLHPLRTLGCLVEVVVALILAGAVAGILVDLVAAGRLR